MLKNILEENLDWKTIHDSELCTQSPRNEYEKLRVSKLVADLYIFYRYLGLLCLDLVEILPAKPVKASK